MSPTTIPERTQLGASTTNRKYFVDVQDPDVAPGIWVGVFGIQEFKPRPSEPTTQDDSDFDGEGYKSQAVTALTWGGDGKLIRKTTNSDQTAYDPGQEILRKVSDRIGGRLMFRYYEMEPDGPRVEAKAGWGTVTWTPDGGSMESLDTVAFTVTGRGKPSDITHPEAGTAEPVVVSALPSGAAAAASIVIQGAHFTGLVGADKVKVGATNATSYTILSDTAIMAVVPAGTAGVTTVTVGTSVIPYTRA